MTVWIRLMSWSSPPQNITNIQSNSTRASLFVRQKLKNFILFRKSFSWMGSFYEKKLICLLKMNVIHTLAQQLCGTDIRIYLFIQITSKSCFNCYIYSSTHIHTYIIPISFKFIKVFLHVTWTFVGIITSY